MFSPQGFALCSEGFCGAPSPGGGVECVALKDLRCFLKEFETPLPRGVLSPTDLRCFLKDFAAPLPRGNS